jgi:hypothetical protein
VPDVTGGPQPLCSGGNRLDEVGGVVADVVDRGADLDRVQAGFGHGGQEAADVAGVGEGWVEPVPTQVDGDKDRGAVVHPAESVRRLSGDDDRRPPPPIRVVGAAVGVAPQLVQPREAEPASGGSRRKCGTFRACPSRFSHSYECRQVVGPY